MKIILPFIILFLNIPCGLSQNLKFEINNISKIEVYEGFPGKIIQMKDGFEPNFIYDLNSSKVFNPTKYMKTHRILMYYKNSNKIDTILSNGILHSFDNWYKSDVNIIEKYKENKYVYSDSIIGQLKTAEKLRELMADKKYNEAIGLFSKDQQKNIAKFRYEKDDFHYWCIAWTFDDSKFERYKNRIITGNGDFLFEDNEWKISEN